MAEKASDASHDKTAETYEERAANTTENARVLRDFLLQVNQDDEVSSEVNQT